MLRPVDVGVYCTFKREMLAMPRTDNAIMIKTTENGGISL